MTKSRDHQNTNRRGAVRLLSLLAALLVSLAVLASLSHPAGFAQATHPIKKKGLLDAIKLNALSTKELVARIQQRGVDFQLTPADEAELTRAGARPEIISAARDNYRPPVAAAAPSRPPAASTPPGNGGNTARPAANVPDGPPLGKNEIITLLQNGVPPTRVEQVVEKRGVSFSVTPEIAREITAAGGTRSLVGAITEKSLAETAAAGSSPAVGNNRNEGPDYDDLTDRAAASMQANDFNGAVRLLQQAISLDASKPTAYQLLGINMLYAQQNFPAAQQAMRAAIERDGAAVFRVYHDHDGFFNNFCQGSFFVNKTGVSFKADDGNHTFEADDSNIKEAKTNGFVGAEYGAFHIKPRTKINGKDNFNFAPATRQKAEAQLLISMIQGY